MTRYRTIVADPPWAYEGFCTHPHAQPINRAKPLPYTAMTIEAIKALPVADLAANACRLFLWTTNRYLPDAFDVVKAWGFGYTQALVWHKTGNPSPFGGSVAPNHAEFLLVAKRGSVEVVDRWPTSVIAANKPRDEHSRKPDVFLDLVERVSPGPYLELFARRRRFGWGAWGDEIDSDVHLAA
jgi:N6-adenosine-specific RNA methylase IME4